MPAGSRALNFRTHVGQAGKSFIEVEMQPGQLQLFSISDLRSETKVLNGGSQKQKFPFGPCRNRDIGPSTNTSPNTFGPNKFLDFNGNFNGKMAKNRFSAIKSGRNVLQPSS